MIGKKSGGACQHRGRYGRVRPRLAIQSQLSNNPMPAQRWFTLCEKTGLDGQAVWTVLADAYGESSRAYHNMHHIGDCLLRFDEHAHLADDRVAVELAIWFHDMVYDTRAADNEERSAVVAAEFLFGRKSPHLLLDLLRGVVIH